MSQPKVFGIGFHKTGTTSLGEALELLGYRVCGPIALMEPQLNERVEEIALEYVKQYDAFQDNPWPILYRTLDEHYPGSKFVLTVRPLDRWIRSVVNHFGHDVTRMREWIYGPAHGYPEGNEEIYVARHERHVEEVLEYFKDRPDDLLVLRLTAGDGWEQLCPFLGHETPATPFPQANVASRSGKIFRTVRRAARRALHR